MPRGRLSCRTGMRIRSRALMFSSRKPQYLKKPRSSRMPMARKQKAMPTPMPALTGRGSRSRRDRNSTIGSAARASTAPSTKGENSGNRNRKENQRIKNVTARQRMVLNPERRENSSFIREYRGCFFGKVCYNS